MDRGQDITNRLSNAQLLRVRELFHEVLDTNPPDLSAFLDQACGDDVVVRVELERMLLAHGASGAWIDKPYRPEMEEPAAVSLICKSIGPYVILKQIGSGGMGSVFLAERPIGRVRQQVALKLVRTGLTGNAEILRRFQQEREILASLDHPNIARLLDIGSTEDGVPFLVMDYVDGKPIDEYCNERNLAVPARLALFLIACGAIEYAHSKGVIHRDLKPANILVTADNTLKLLDFGIARVLDAEGRTQTQTGSALMTIEYASPEQVRGEHVGPTSDVYSLGVILYEMLTGQKPYRTAGRLIHSIARAICEDEPVAPSVAEARLAGDLESILLKALRKRPEWRYASPADLSDDIRRHLSGERVLARKESIRYWAERMLHRILYPSEGVFHTHSMLLLTAGLLGVLLLGERHAVALGWRADVQRSLDILAVAAWLCWSLQEGWRMRRRGQFSALDTQSWIVFTTLTVALGLLTLVSALRESIAPDAIATFWNLGLAVGLIAVGLQASRIMIAGGVALLSSALLGSFVHTHVYGVLASGMFFGMVIPGLILVIQTPLGPEQGTRR